MSAPECTYCGESWPETIQPNGMHRACQLALDLAFIRARCTVAIKRAIFEDEQERKPAKAVRR